MNAESAANPQLSLLTAGDHNHHRHHHRQAPTGLVAENMNGGVLWGGAVANPAAAVHDSYFMPSGLGTTHHHGLPGDFSLDAGSILDFTDLGGESSVLSPFPPVDRRGVAAVRRTAAHAPYNVDPVVVGQFHDSERAAAQHCVDDDHQRGSAVHPPTSARGVQSSDFMSASAHPFTSEVNHASAAALWSGQGSSSGARTCVPNTGTGVGIAGSAAVKDSIGPPGSLMHHNSRNALTSSATAAMNVRKRAVASAEGSRAPGVWDDVERGWDKERYNREMFTEAISGSLRRDVYNNELHRPPMFDHRLAGDADPVSVSRAVRHTADAHVLNGGIPGFPSYRTRVGSESFVAGNRSSATAAAALSGYGSYGRLTRNPDLSAGALPPESLRSAAGSLQLFRTDLRANVNMPEDCGLATNASPSHLSELSLTSPPFPDPSQQLSDRITLGPRLSSNAYYPRASVPQARRQVHYPSHHRLSDGAVGQHKLPGEDLGPFLGNVTELENSEFYATAATEHNAAALRSVQKLNAESALPPLVGDNTNPHYHQDLTQESLGHLTEESVLKHGASLNLKLPDGARNMFDLHHFDLNSTPTPSTVGSLTAMNRQSFDAGVVSRASESKQRGSVFAGTPPVASNFAAMLPQGTAMPGAQQAAFLNRVQSASHSRFSDNQQSDLWSGSLRDRGSQFRNWTESPSQLPRANSLAGRRGGATGLSQDMQDQLQLRGGFSSTVSTSATTPSSWKGAPYSSSSHSEKQLTLIPPRSEEMQLAENSLPLTMPQFERLIKVQSNAQNATLSYLHDLKTASELGNDNTSVGGADGLSNSRSDNSLEVDSGEDSQRLLEALQKFVRVAESSLARQRGAGADSRYSVAEPSNTAAVGGDYLPNLYSDMYNAKAKSFSAVAPTRTSATNNNFHAALSSLRQPLAGRSFSQDRLDMRRPGIGNARSASFQAQHLTHLSAISESLPGRGGNYAPWGAAGTKVDDVNSHNIRHSSFSQQNLSMGDVLATQRQDHMNATAVLKAESYSSQQNRDVPTQPGTSTTGNSGLGIGHGGTACGAPKENGYGNGSVLVDCGKGNNVQYTSDSVSAQPLLSDSQATAAALLLAAVGVPEFDAALTQAHLRNVEAEVSSRTDLRGDAHSSQHHMSSSIREGGHAFYPGCITGGDTNTAALAALLTLAGVSSGEGQRKSERFGSAFDNHSFGETTTSTNVSNDQITTDEDDNMKSLSGPANDSVTATACTMQKLNGSNLMGNSSGNNGRVSAGLEGIGNTYITSVQDAGDLKNFILSNDDTSVAALMQHLQQQQNGSRLGEHVNGGGDLNNIRGSNNAANCFDDSNHYLSAANGATASNNLNFVVDHHSRALDAQHQLRLQNNTPATASSSADSVAASKILNAFTARAVVDVNDQMEAASSTQRNSNSSDGVSGGVMDSSTFAVAADSLSGVNNFQAQVQALLGVLPGLSSQHHQQMTNAQHIPTTGRGHSLLGGNDSRGGSYSRRPQHQSSEEAMTFAAAANSLEAAGLQPDELLHAIRDQAAAAVAANNHKHQQVAAHTGGVLGTNFFGNGSPSGNDVSAAQSASLTRSSLSGGSLGPPPGVGDAQQQPPQQQRQQALQQQQMDGGGMSVFSMPYPTTAAGVLRHEQMTSASNTNARSSFFSSTSGASQSSSLTQSTRSSVNEGVLGLTSQLLQQGMTPQRVNSVALLGSLGLSVHPALCGSNGDSSNPNNQSPQNQIRRVYTDDRDRMVYVSWIPKKGRAYNTADKRKMELDLKQKLRDMGLHGLTKVLLFPPKGVHCKLIFDSRQSAGAFMQRYGGENFSAETEAWKSDMCKLYDIDMHEKFDKTVVKIEWSQK